MTYDLTQRVESYFQEEGIFPRDYRDILDEIEIFAGRDARKSAEAVIRGESNLPVKTPSEDFFATRVGFSNVCDLFKSCMYEANKWILEQATRYLSNQQSGNVLDIGCAIGIEACFLAESLEQNRQVVGLDICRKILSIASERAKRRKIGNIVYVNANSDKLPFSNQTFDSVLYLRSLTEGTRETDLTLQDETIKRRLAETRRILNKGGQVVIAEIAMASYIFQAYKIGHIGERIESAGLSLEDFVSQSFETSKGRRYSFIMFRAIKP